MVVNPNQSLSGGKRMSKLKWRDAEDAYKPVNQILLEFLREKHKLREIRSENIEALHRKTSAKEMSVFIFQEAETKIKEHLTKDSYNETGGILVGQAYFCPSKKTHYTEIVGAIPALYTVGNRVHFKFTPECWQEIFSRQKQDFPETTIVGWYHSHPGHGIFLSSTDINTQQSSFKQIWHIAIVYDPIRHEIGFFHGSDGKFIDPIYLQAQKQALPSKTQEAKLHKLPSPASSENSPNLEDKAANGQEIVTNKEQQNTKQDNLSENILSAMDKLYSHFRKVVESILGTSRQ